LPANISDFLPWSAGLRASFIGILHKLKQQSKRSGGRSRLPKMMRIEHFATIATASAHRA
jgi:hypothetical protein